MKKSINHSQLFVSIGAVFGLIAISKSLVPWFFGNDFLILSNIIPLFAPLLAIVPLGMAISRQYSLPVGEIKKYNYSVVFGAVISIIISLSTINYLGIYAAILATIVSGIFVTFSRVYSFVKKENFIFNRLLIFKFFLSGILMLLSVNFITSYFEMEWSPITTMIQVIIGVLVYLTSIFILKASPLKIWKDSSK